MSIVSEHLHADSHQERGDAAAAQSSVQWLPLGEGCPQDAAGLIVYLASDEALTRRE